MIDGLVVNFPLGFVYQWNTKLPRKPALDKFSWKQEFPNIQMFYNLSSNTQWIPAPLTMSCCPSLAKSFVSNGWRSLLPSLWQDQIKRCTQDGWAQSEWKIGGQAKIFPVFSSLSPFAAFCQINDVRGQYYLFCFPCWFCLVYLSAAISMLMTG